MIYAVAFTIVYTLRVFLKLNLWSTALLVMWGVFMLHKHKRIYHKMKFNQQKFYEVSLYLDTLLYSFVKEEKVELAMRDVSQTLPAGRLKTLVDTVLDYMNMTFDEVELLEESMAMIEQEYPCKRVRDVHKFITHVEYYGGDIEKPVNLLLADKIRWEKRIKAAMAWRNKQLIDIILSVIASLIICSAIIYLPIADTDISQHGFVQLFAVLLIIGDDWVIYCGQKYLAVDWIQWNFSQEEEAYAIKMERYYQYDEKKERKLSYWLGGVCGALTLGAMLMRNQWLTLLGMAMTLFLWNQHRIGRQLAKKNLTKEIKYAFPNWLLDLVLLLQSENVQVALQKSREYVPGVLRRDLYWLTERLELQPESSEPYHAFLKDFAIPEIHSAMGILYSLSIGNSGNAERQIGELVDKNLELLDTMESERLRNAGNGMYVLFLIPVLTASFKLVIDMIVLMLHFLQTPLI